MTTEVQLSRKASAFWMVMTAAAALVCGSAAIAHFHEKAVAKAKTETELARTKAKLAEMKLTVEGAEDNALLAMRESAGHGYMELDKDSRVIDWNPALVEWTGYALEEMKGQTLARVMAPEDYAKHSAAYPNWIAADDSRITTLRLDCKLVAKDGRKIPVIVTARKVPAVEGVGDELPKAMGLIDRPKTVLDLTGK